MGWTPIGGGVGRNLLCGAAFRAAAFVSGRRRRPPSVCSEEECQRGSLGARPRLSGSPAPRLSGSPALWLPGSPALPGDGGCRRLIYSFRMFWKRYEGPSFPPRLRGSDRGQLFACFLSCSPRRRWGMVTLRCPSAPPVPRPLGQQLRVCS